MMNIPRATKQVRDLRQDRATEMATQNLEDKDYSAMIEGFYTIVEGTNGQSRVDYTLSDIVRSKKLCVSEYMEGSTRAKDPEADKRIMRLNLTAPEPTKFGITPSDVIRFAEAILVTLFQLNFAENREEAIFLAIVIPAYSFVNSSLGCLEIPLAFFSNLVSLVLALTRTTDDEGRNEIISLVSLQIISGLYELLISFRARYMLKNYNFPCIGKYDAKSRLAVAIEYHDKVHAIFSTELWPLWLQDERRERGFCSSLVLFILFVLARLPDYVVVYAVDSIYSFFVMCLGCFCKIRRVETRMILIYLRRVGVVRLLNLTVLASTLAVIVLGSL